jgi:hypothetical protein
MDGLIRPVNILLLVIRLHSYICWRPHSVCPLLLHAGKYSKACIRLTLPSRKKTQKTHIFSQATKRSPTSMSIPENHQSLQDTYLAYLLSPMQESCKRRTTHAMAGDSPLRFFLRLFRIESDHQHSRRSHCIRQDSLTA